MFKFLKPPRTILGMSRLPIHVERRLQQGQAYMVQTVRFQKTPFPKRFRATGISLLVCYGFWRFYEHNVLNPLAASLMEAVGSLPPEALQEEVEPFFIPFPGTTKEIKPKAYRGSDPEWQEFVKFSKDQDLGKRVREELAQFVRTVAEKHPVLMAKCGTGMKLRRYWLDIDFPTHPPPEFERSGIEIADDYIAWSTMSVDSGTVFKIRSALWPSALAKSFWSFIKVMVTDDAKKVARIIGLPSGAPPPTIDQLLARHQQIMKGGPPTKDGPPKAKQPQLLGDSQNTMMPVPASTSVTSKPTLAEEESESKLKKIVLGVTSHYERGLTAFKMKLKQTWRPAPNYPPRGSIMVQGLVEIDSPRAWLVFDVKAAWDPKTKTYDSRSLHIALRRMQAKRQAPVGGL